MNSLVKNIFKSPWFQGFFFFIIGVMSSSYFTSLETRKLTFYVNPAKAAIVSTDKSDKLKVYFEGKLLERNVTAVNIAFWNAGKTPIKKDEVLEKLEFRTPKNVPILEVKLTKVSRDVVGLEIDRTKLPEGILPLSWKILEKNDGAVIQVIYAGTANDELSAHSVILGQEQIDSIKYPGSIKSAKEQYANAVDTRNRNAYLVLGLGVMGLAFYAWKTGIKKEFGKLDVVYLLFCAIYIGLGIYSLFFNTFPLPPFGF
jgi:hypothetical protein